MRKQGEGRARSERDPRENRRKATRGITENYARNSKDNATSEGEPCESRGKAERRVKGPT